MESIIDKLGRWACNHRLHDWEELYYIGEVHGWGGIGSRMWCRCRRCGKEYAVEDVV